MSQKSRQNCRIFAGFPIPNSLSPRPGNEGFLTDTQVKYDFTVYSTRKSCLVFPSKLKFRGAVLFDSDDLTNFFAVILTKSSFLSRNSSSLSSWPPVQKLTAAAAAKLRGCVSLTSSSNRINYTSTDLLALGC
jgi:hypothetical protein